MKVINDVKFLIVGLGLIGGSYAQALTDLGYEVGAITRSQSSIDYAIEKKLIAHGTTEVTKEYVEQFDIIVFALYPKVFVEWIEKYQSYFKAGAIITDVTGVKGAIVYEIQEMLREDVEFVPAHPMAGKEVYGVQNADKTIFTHANYIVTPTSKNTPEAIKTIKQLGRLLGFKTVTELSPEEHDEMIGFLSQLTHCIAVSLMDCKESEYLVDYTGDSFRDLTRIAKINDAMWSELFLLNKSELLSQMDLFMSKFTELRNALESEDIEKMREMMRISTERRKYFDK
ncbi:MAG: prephenate dehydrogenase [Clostridia bacterium]|nr:prephenate dehydrogenase [Clostridia bacterium]MBR2296333.1 prephenate dehydrogenase [Clostridia bacterium]